MLAPEEMKKRKAIVGLWTATFNILRGTGIISHKTEQRVHYCYLTDLFMYIFRLHAFCYTPAREQV